MTDYLAEYRDYLSESKGASANTLESYTRDIRQFIRYLSEHNVEDPTTVTADQIHRYFESLHLFGRSQSTVTRSLASVRSYYQYLMRAGRMDFNPASKIQVEKVQKKLPEILTQKEIDLLLAQPDAADPKGCRDKAMLELMYATGVRVSELVNLNVTDINLQINILHCRSEKNERIVPVYHAAIKAVSDYLTRIRPTLISDLSEQALFLNLNGERLTRQGFWKIIKSYAEEAGIKKTITPHTMRHSFATHLLENGAGLKDIKEMLGHSDISSTQIYSQLMKAKYTAAYKQFHPRASK